MRWLIFAFALAGPALHAVTVGDSRDAVIAELGQPIGELDLGDRVRLMFTAGDVTLVDGQVSKHAIKTAAQLEREAEVREIITQQWAERRAEEQAASIDKGRAWLDYLKLASTAITDQDIQGLLAHWRTIQKEYPQADIAAEYEATLALAEARAAEIKQRREEQRIAALEQRVANAEQRAAAAEQQAQQTQYVSYSYGNAYPYYYRPPQSVVVIGNGGVCYPPKPVIPCNTGNGGLQANYSNDNFSISYNSGGGYGSLLRQNFNPPSRPIVITTSGN